MNQPPQKTAFLDTNALIRMFGFWETCHWGRLEMGEVESRSDLRQKLKSNNIPGLNQFTREHFNSVASGLKCFQALTKAKDRYQYFSSLVCRSEMHRVILSGHAHAGLSRNRVPLSLQQSRPLILHQAVLKDEDYDRINGEITQFFDTLKEDHDIDIKNIENDGNADGNLTEEIFQTAEAIWSQILIETMDAYIYAAAIAARADYFLTGDNALKSTANKLHNPDTKWKSISTRLKSMIERPGDLLPLNFPQGFGVSIDKLP